MGFGALVRLVVYIQTNTWVNGARQESISIQEGECLGEFSFYVSSKFLAAYRKRLE